MKNNDNDVNSVSIMLEANEISLADYLDSIIYQSPNKKVIREHMLDKFSTALPLSRSAWM